MNYRVFFISILLINLGYSSYGQGDSTGFSFLDQGMYFDALILDPMECQNSGGILKLWDSEGQDAGIYILVNIGFRQSLARYNIKENQGLEFGVEVGVYTQFTIKEVESNTYLGEMENADYKLSFLLNYKSKAFSLRSRLFHISSHLADDYIIRNQITDDNPGILNYEQFDVTGSWQTQAIRYYAGTGMVITPNAVRKRFSAQLGLQYRKRLKNNHKIRKLVGVDIKIFEQNDFTPNIKAGIGFETGQPDKVHFGFMLEYYNGHLPYSTLEYKKVQWLGVSVLLPAPR